MKVAEAKNTTQLHWANHTTGRGMRGFVQPGANTVSVPHAWSQFQVYARCLSSMYIVGLYMTIAFAVLAISHAPFWMVVMGPAVQAFYVAWRSNVWRQHASQEKPKLNYFGMKLVVLSNILLLCGWAFAISGYLPAQLQPTLVPFCILFGLNTTLFGIYSPRMTKFSIIIAVIAVIGLLLISAPLNALIVGFFFLGTTYIIFRVSVENQSIVAALHKEKRISEQERTKAVHLANHDQLTGALNRSSFWNTLQDEAAKSEKTGEIITIILLDLDGFKGINDVHGHLAGDFVLAQAASRIAAIIGETGVVARLGGDEFGIVIPKTEDIPHTTRIASMIIEALEEAIYWSGIAIRISGSAGLYHFSGMAEKLSRIVEKADHALYAAKKYDKGRVVTFTTSLDREMEQRSMFRQKLREAIFNHQIDICLQPVIDCQHGNIAFFEVLARWYDDEFGQVPPTEFVMIAEEIGLSNELFVCVLTKAVKQVKSLPNSPSISVNLAPIQLAMPNLLENISPILEAHDFDPKRLKLEMTEFALIQKPIATQKTIAKLRTHGIDVILDDFGAGYASLSMIDQYDFAIVKLDRTLMKGILESESRRTIFKAVVRLCKKLGIPCVAEGTEYDQMLGYVMESGCELVQGYYISKPKPVEAFEMVENYAELVDRQAKKVTNIRLASSK